ncbi:MAG: hypothetical protein HUJ63_07145 [Enterococcus sp.]|nr:hypothetical protein [Enterococcus sp.]
MINIDEIAQNADMIVNGYSFTWVEDKILVLNLVKPTSAVTFDSKGNVIETTMDDIELSIVKNYLKRNDSNLKACYA